MDTEKQKRIYRFIKDSIINIAVAGISLAYMFYNMVTLSPTNLSIVECLCKSAVAIICGVMIKQGLGENGFNKGYNSSVWETELNKYNGACNLANPYMDRVANFYYSQEIEKRINYRRALLMGARLKYSDFFDEEENFVGEEKLQTLTRFQRHAVHKCVRVKIYNLNLFSEYSTSSSSDTKRETGDSHQRVKMFGKNSIMQIVFAVAGVYFVPMINSWDWGLFIMATLQVAGWVGSGVMQLYTNYNYITIEKVDKLKKKKELINKFVLDCEHGMYKENPYDLRAKKEMETKQVEIQKTCDIIEKTIEETSDNVGEEEAIA